MKVKQECLPRLNVKHTKLNLDEMSGIFYRFLIICDIFLICVIMSKNFSGGFNEEILLYRTGSNFDDGSWLDRLRHVFK